MKLSTRLLLLILGCLFPILAAQVYSQINLYAERQQQLGALMMRQAELASADVASIIDGVHQLGILASQFVDPAGDGNNGAEHCSSRLDSLRAGLPRYRVLAMYDPSSQAVVCASEDQGAGLLPQAPRAPDWMSDLAVGDEVVAGRAVFPKGSPDGIIPIAAVLPASGGMHLKFVAGLSVSWLADHMRLTRTERSAEIAGSELFVTDREGLIIGHTGGGGAAVAARLPAWIAPVVARGHEGVVVLEDPNHRSFIVGFVPATMQPLGIGVVEILPLTEATADLDQANYQDLIVIGCAACVALLLAWLAGRRFIVKPTDVLMQAARRWREGDLHAQATLDDSGSEFAALAASFNAMATDLAKREEVLAQESSHLEAQVAERTRELSESNNRLQVEIAGREKTEAALLQAQKLQAVGQLAGGIAHDFNNMLATFLGNLELMERRISQARRHWAEGDFDRLVQLIERATSAVQRGSQLTARLLAFSRRQRLAARATDINALLQELITLASSTLGRRIQVVAELSPDLWPAMVDPSQVEAAILNLCLNARDAMPNGGTLTIRTDNAPVAASQAGTQSGRAADDAGRERDLTPGDYIRIRISDTGSGMTPDVKARAFDPFFTTKGPGAGSGLGLSQVYGMARQSGGNVSIDSAPGEGTVVTLLLPRTSAIENAASAAPAPTAERAGSLPKEMVLVVDDDAAVRQVTVEMARDLGCEVIQAAGGEQALALLEAQPAPPRFILLDYAMPGMNGLQLAKAIRDRSITAPIALVTGYAELSDLDVATSSLAGLLRKPFTIRELEGLMAQLRTAREGKPVEDCQGSRAPGERATV